jgi:toxin HigB-1
MILSFDDQTTEDIYNGVNSKAARKLPMVIWDIAFRKLDMINAAEVLNDLRIPRANRLKLLKGNWEGYYSIRVNDQYRIVFR